MMKEIYEVPKMEVVVFETEDIITTSDPFSNDGDTLPGTNPSA